MERLEGKVAVITGGGTGIGLGIGQCFVEEGASVVLAQRRVEIAKVEAAKFRAEGHQAIGVKCDVSHRSDFQALISQTLETYGKIDILINNAALTGQAAEGRAFLDETDEHWRHIIDINLTGVFIGTQEAAKVMVSQGHGGSIINISSVAQYAAQEHAVPYCASKAGLDGLTKAAAIELAPHQIRVNNVAPGDIYTEASAEVTQEAADRGATGHYVRYTPLNRRGKPEEIGHVVVLLASDDAGFVTGATWLVDGGFLSY